MTTNQGFDRVLVDWLDRDGPSDVPARIVDAAIAQAEKTGQVRDWLSPLRPAVAAAPAWRVTRNSRTAWVLLAAALAAILAVGALVAGQLNHRSPLGPPGLIAYSVEGRLMLSNVDGSDRRPVAGAGTVASNPAWSPDGRQLAFWSGGSWDEPFRNLIVTDVGRGGTTVIARDIPYPSHLSWSPDGRSITFGAVDRLTGISVSVIYVVDVDTAKLRHVPTRDLIAIDPQWSPTDDLILFFGHGFDQENGLYVIRSDGTGLTRVTHRTVTDYYLRSFNQSSWSPDGTRVAYFAGDVQHDIWVASVDGTDDHPVSDDPQDEILPQWSPDGSTIAWVRGENPRMQLVVAAPDGTDQHVVSGTYPIVESVPRWAPDASSIVVPVYDSVADKADQLGVFDPTGQDPPRFVALQGDSSGEPSWQRRP